ncbi:MAG TPA: carotenoid biosynthesis protein [Pyrinomonadaceae bacterium]|jgi:putative membrane protein
MSRSLTDVNRSSSELKNESPTELSTLARALKQFSPPRRFILLALLALYAFLWLGGAGHLLTLGSFRPEQSWITNIFLGSAGLVVLTSATAGKDFYRLALVALLGFIFELIGVRYGVPFGEYVYTDALRPKLFGVPLVMSFAWMLLVAYVRQMLGGLRLTSWAVAPVGALWMTAIDLLIDPSAANSLDYWRWTSEGVYYRIPATNFLGWFLTSLVALAVVSGQWRANPFQRLVGLSIILFFLAAALAQSFFLAAAVGLCLCLLHALVRRLTLKSDANSRSG